MNVNLSLHIQRTATYYENLRTGFGVLPMLRHYLPLMPTRSDVYPRHRTYCFEIL
jgi:hypothetical protein